MRSFRQMCTHILTIYALGYSRLAVTCVKVMLELLQLTSICFPHNTRHQTENEEGRTQANFVGDTGGPVSECLVLPP